MLKLDGATGEVLWSQHYAGSEGLDEAALAVACGPQDEVFFTGRGSVSGEGMQMLTMRLDPDDGHILWSDFYGRSTGGDDLAWDLVVGPDGHPVVAGLSLDGSGVAWGVTRKLDAADGGELWNVELATGLNDFTSTGAWLALLDGGDVAVCRRAYGAQGYDVLLTRRAAADGGAVWSVRYDGPTGGGDDPHHMIADDAGDLLVTGVQDAFWNYDYMLLKFAGPDGGLVWEAPGYDGPPGWYDSANRVAIAANGTIVVTGLSDGQGTGWDVATVGYEPSSGSIDWVLRQDGPASGSDAGRDLACNAAGDVYVTGYGYGLTTGKDHLTLHYQFTPGGVPAAAASFALEPPYPNPFNPATTLAFRVDAAGPARLAVYGLDGRLVRVLRDGPVPVGRHAVRWDGRDDRGGVQAAGVYLVRLTTPAGSASGTVVLLK